MALKETVDKIENQSTIKEPLARIEKLEMEDKNLELLNRQLDNLEGRKRTYNL